MLPVIWRDRARQRLAAIMSYVADSNPRAARDLKKRLQTMPELLSLHPYLYPEGRMPGTREVVAHPNYIIVYRVRTDHIEIVNVVHARRQYP